MKKRTIRITAILIAIVMLIGSSIGIMSVFGASSYDPALVADMEEVMAEFEEKMDGSLYTNMSTAYELYVSISKYYDRYYLAGEGETAGLSTTTISEAVTDLWSAMSKMKVWSPPAVTNSSLNNSDKVWSGDHWTWADSKQWYQNVVWSNKDYDESVRAYIEGTQSDWRYSNTPTLVNSTLYYPAYALLYDGVADHTPSFGVLIKAAGRSGYGNDRGKNRYAIAAIPLIDDITLKRNWTTGLGDTIDHSWNMVDVKGQLSYSLASKTAGSTGVQVRVGVSSGSATLLTYYFSNIAYYSGNMTSNGTTLYSTSFYPSFQLNYDSEGIDADNWNRDISVPLNGDYPVYVLNYAPLRTELYNHTTQLSNISNYREGGLSALIKALDAGMAFNYNDEFKGLEYYEIKDKVEECAETIEDLENAIKNAKVTSDQFNGLRDAIKKNVKVYEDGNGTFADSSTWIWCEAKDGDASAKLYSKVFVEAFENAQTYLDVSARSNPAYSNAANAETRANTLTNAREALTEHKPDYQNGTISDINKATCTTAGTYKETYQCPNCKMDEEHLRDIPVPDSHVLVKYEGRKQTCTEGAIADYWACETPDDEYHDYCGLIFADENGSQQLGSVPEAGAPAGHKMTVYQQQRDPSCSAEGYKQTIWSCSVCNKYFLDDGSTTTNEAGTDVLHNNPIEKTAHNYSFTPAKDATCQHTGNYAYYHCDMCGHYFTVEPDPADRTDRGESEPIIPIDDHKFTNYVYDPTSQADDKCVTPGMMTASCDYECGETNSIPDPNHPAIGHKFEKDGAATPYQAPTCYDAGHIAYYTCDNCDKNFSTDSDSSVVPLDEELAIPATGKHNLVYHGARTATCLDAGYDEYWQCSVCNGLFSGEQTEGQDIKEFDTANQLKDAEKNPITDITQWERYVALGQHNLIPHSEHIGTCVDKGWKAYYECSTCSKYFSTNVQNDPDDPIEDHEISDLNSDSKSSWMQPGKHLIITTGGNAPTCIEPGENVHYECVYCHNWFDSDGDDAQQIEEQDPIAPVDSNNHEGGWIEHTGGQDASCTQEGWSKTVYECKGCGHYYLTYDGRTTESRDDLGDDPTKIDGYTAPLAHDQDDERPQAGDPFVAPTCTSKGVQLVDLYCSACGSYQTTTAVALNTIAHDPTTKEVQKGYPATCQDTGEKDHFTCEMCGQFFADSKCEGDPIDIVIPTVNHDFSNSTDDYTVIVTNATCTTNAIVEYLCTYDCKTHSAAAERSDGKYGKTDHDLTKHEKAATCLEDGEPLYYSCANCGFNFADKEEYTENYYTGNTSTPATGHDFALVDTDAEEANCEKEGVLAYYVCNNDNCDLTVEGEKAKFLDTTDRFAKAGISSDKDLKTEKDFTKHTHLEYKSGTAATCYPWTPGMRDYNYCDGCKNYYEVSDVNYATAKTRNDFVDAPKHTLTHFDSNEVSCTKDGNIEGYSCDVCGEMFLDYTPEARHGVDYDKEIAIFAEGHSFGEYIKVVATCVVDGIAGHYKCSECQIIVICDEADKDKEDVKFYDGDDTDKIDLGTDENNHVNINPETGSDATCLDPGLKDHFKCADCGKLFEDEKGNQELTDDDIVADPLGHDFTADDAHHEYKAPTCTAPGVQEYWHCARCGKDFKNDANNTTNEWDSTVIGATGHQNIVPIEGKDATCTDDGIEDHYICKDCNTEFVDEKGETEVDDKNVKIDALGHEEAKAVRENEVPATCLADGSYQEVVYCVRHDACGYEFSRVDKTINKISHEFGEYTSDNNATCLADGTKTRYCIYDCGTKETVTDEGSMLSHDWDDGMEIKAPTCVEDGIMRYTCKLCAVTTYDEPILATGKHTYEVVESKDATCLEDGYIKYECSVCGDPKTEILDAAGAHSWDNGTVTKKATCTEKGEMTYKCTICGETKTEPIEMIEHTPGEAQVENYVPATPETEGSYDLVVRCTECRTILSSVHVTIDPIDDEVDLKILEGADQTYAIDSYIDKTIVCNGPYNKFVGVLLKGEIVDESNYTVREGSTVVTFKAEYLNTLAPGKYEVVLMYTYDSVATTLTVTENPNSGSGDSGNGGNGGNGGSGNSGNTGNVPGGNTGNGGTGSGQDTTQGSNGSGANANNSNTSPSTGTEIALPIILVATVGGFIAIMFARRRKASDAE